MNELTRCVEEIEHKIPKGLRCVGGTWPPVPCPYLSYEVWDGTVYCAYLDCPLEEVDDAGEVRKECHVNR